MLYLAHSDMSSWSSTHFLVLLAVYPYMLFLAHSALSFFFSQNCPHLYQNKRTQKTEVAFMAKITSDAILMMNLNFERNYIINQNGTDKINSISKISLKILSGL